MVMVPLVLMDMEGILVQEGKIQLMKGVKNFDFPNHFLFAYDIMFFCKGTNKSLISLRILLLSMVMLLASSWGF